jgi:4'-phosphopantetheinyl transferase
MTPAPTPLVPPLTNDDIHVWHTAWTGGAGEARFAALLAAYTAPEHAPILRGPHGKPHLASPLDTIGFSWSHSADTALFAIGRGPSGFEVGVDVEVRRPRARALELARRFFAPQEAAILEQLPPDEHLAAFLTLWTAKEAVLKAHGGGLSYGLHRASFRIEKGTAVPDTFDGDLEPASAWSLRPLALQANVVATVAWRGPSRRVSIFTSSL